jgi:hypothetical protein
MTGSLKARQPHRRDFSVSASIPVLSIARGSELWGLLVSALSAFMFLNRKTVVLTELYLVFGEPV